ncbi:peptidase domain-containing ABC transporter [Amantichitinum ursilacus]|uniref:Cyclolysin secretion/processing ATP-binding protein CyaB n=1 Tax=Amantichitinum ursilacus TaxID=857265 RepID=A0A0N0GN70_9NEIS|nr:peptidase domain-containing ABC transporter [Amantichitinum ursilacus]KPC52554.1 Toxin RTX-I translocation ATP-binding protein [Amantichitinum ursilacus]
MTDSANAALNWRWRRRLPVIRQTEAAECGVACLAMVASWHGYRVDLPTLRARFGVTQRGMTFARLVDCAALLDLATRPLRLEMGDLIQLATPCVLYWDLNHFVVLKKVRGQRVEIHDPARGCVTLSLAEVSKHFTGIALELTPTHTFVAQDQRRRIRLRELTGRTQGLKAALVRIFVFALVLEALALLAPFLNQIVIDEVLVAQDQDLLVLILIGMALLTATQTLIGLVREWATLSMAVNFNMQWTANVLHHLWRLPLAWFEKRHIGEISARFDAVDTLQHTLTTSSMQALLDVLLALGTLVMMLLYSPKLAAIALLAAALYALLRAACFGPLRRAADACWMAGTQESSHFLESLRGMLSLRVNAATPRRETAWRNLNVARRNAQLHQSKLEMAYHVVNTLLASAVAAATTWWGVQAVLGNAFSVGMLVAYMSFQGRFTASINSLIDKIAEFKMLAVYNERLADIVLTPVSALEHSSVPPIAAEVQTEAIVVEVTAVRFRYGPGEPDILRNVDLQLRAGEIVALVGSSGGGKTTLLKLILGVYQPDQGGIRVLGHDIRQAGFASVRTQIGTVLQDDALFSGSILDNITLFAPDHDVARAQQCATRARLHAEVSAMPMGYQTAVTEYGGSLSGGQKQRLLLARALYKRPRLLLLDEATSHLDTANERQINQMLRDLGVAILLIAHRPETIASADRVLQLEHGRLV